MFVRETYVIPVKRVKVQDRLSLSKGIQLHLFTLENKEAARGSQISEPTGMAARFPSGTGVRTNSGQILVLSARNALQTLRN